MENKWIITIGRQFCSGGSEVGYLLSQKLGIPYYDKKLVYEASLASSISESVVEANEEKPVSSWQFLSSSGNYPYTNYDLVFPLGMRVAEAQFDAIKKLADNGPCIFIGRCADYILSERSNILSVFIRSDIDIRIDRAVELYNLTRDEAKREIKKSDKNRSNYYKYYTLRDWGSIDNYNLVLDSGLLGIDGCAHVIEQTLEYLTDQKKEQK